jgi:hypothetical protein
MVVVEPSIPVPMIFQATGDYGVTLSDLRHCPSRAAPHRACSMAPVLG